MDSLSYFYYIKYYTKFGIPMQTKIPNKNHRNLAPPVIITEKTLLSMISLAIFISR